MLTKSDKNYIDGTIDKALKDHEKRSDEKLTGYKDEIHCEIKNLHCQIEQFDEKLIEFKDEILGEIKALREDITIVVGYRDMIEDHEIRIEKLENLTRTQ